MGSHVIGVSTPALLEDTIGQALSAAASQYDDHEALVLAESLKTSQYFEMIQSLAPELGGSEPGKFKSEKLPHLEMVIGFAATIPAGFIDFASLPERATTADKGRITPTTTFSTTVSSLAKPWA